MGLVDIFLPDLKYFDSRLGEKYSGVPKYFKYASEAIRTMFAMTGPARIGDDGLLKRGMIIRHLVLPWQWRDSCRCLDWIHETFGDDVFVSVMNQYMPISKACLHPEINPYRSRIGTLCINAAYPPRGVPQSAPVMD